MNLRDQLGGLADQAGPYADPDKALAKANRRRTVKLTLAPLAIVLAAAVGIPFAANGLPGGGSPAANPSASENPQLPELGVDYMVGNSLVTTGGRVYLLKDWEGGDVQKTPLGWLVNQWDAGTYLLKANGTTVPIGDRFGEGPLVLSSDGTRIAYQEGGEFKVSRITAEGLEEIASVPDTEVNSIAGWSGDRVVFFLADESAGSENADVSWGVWDPEGSGWVTDWYPGSPDYTGTQDQMLFWDEPNGGYCLVRADIETGAETGRRCDLDTQVLPSRISPDGLYALSDPYGDTPKVFTVDDVFTDAGAQPAPACGAANVNDEAWLGDVVYMVTGSEFSGPDDPSKVIACAVTGQTVSETAFDTSVSLVQSFGI